MEPKNKNTNKRKAYRVFFVHELIEAEADPEAQNALRRMPWSEPSVEIVNRLTVLGKSLVAIGAKHGETIVLEH